jgi:hypothetical protein
MMRVNTESDTQVGSQQTYIIDVAQTIIQSRLKNTAPVRGQEKKQLDSARNKSRE